MPEKTFHSLTLPGQPTARVPLTAVEFNTGTAYAIRDYCTYQGKLYRCIAAHAAGAWNAAHFTETNIDNELDGKLMVPPYQASAPSNPRVGDLWVDSDENSPVYNVDSQPVAGSTNAVQSGGTFNAIKSVDDRKGNRSLFSGDYSASATYEVNQLVMNGQQMYRCTTRIATPEAWNAAHWTATNLNIEFDRLRTSEADMDMIAENYGDSSSYAVGDYVVHNSDLFKCVSAVGDTGSWDPDDWSQVKIADDVSKLNNTFEKIKQVFPYYPVFVRGSANSNTGKFIPQETVLNRIIETEYISTEEFDTLQIKAGLMFFLCYYSTDKTFISATLPWSSNLITSLDTTKAFVRICLCYPDDSNFDIVPSDAAFFTNSKKELILKSDFTKENLGLGNVNNTSDIDKPISTLTQKALDKIETEVSKKIGFSKTLDKTLIDREDIGTTADGFLANTRRWFIDHIFESGEYLNKVKFKVAESVNPRIIYFEIWEKSGDTLTKKKTVSINTQKIPAPQEAVVYTLALDYNCENECMLSIISNYGSIIYKNLDSADNTILPSSDINVESTSILYSSLKKWYLDPSITVYFDHTEETKVITIGPGMDYEEIQDAIINITDDSVTNPYTFLIMPKGTPYKPFSMLRNSWSDNYPWSNISPRYISIIGIDKAHCIIRSDSGNYKLPCGELMTNGIIKNIKFVMTNDSQDPAATQGGYCLHIDCRTLNDVGYNMVIEDCDFEDASGPCLGIGMHANCTLTIRRCNLKTTLSADYIPFEGYRNLVNYGVIFCHTSSVATATNQRINIEDCFGECSEGNRSLWLATAGDYDSSTASFYYRLLRNIFWNDTQNSSAYVISQTLTADPMNFGNNNS